MEQRRPEFDRSSEYSEARRSSSVETFASPTCAASRIASIGQRTEDGFGASAKSFGSASALEGLAASNTPIAATTAGAALSAPTSSASASSLFELRKAISIAIDRGWKSAKARTMRAIVSRVGAPPPASLSVSSSIATMTTPGGAGRAPAIRKRQSRVRFSIRSSGEARPLISRAPSAAPTTIAAARKPPVRSQEGPGRSSRHSLAETGKEAPAPWHTPRFSAPWTCRSE